MGGACEQSVRNEIIFDFRLRPEAEPRDRLIYGSELGDGVHLRDAERSMSGRCTAKWKSGRGVSDARVDYIVRFCLV